MNTFSMDYKLNDDTIITIQAEHYIDEAGFEDLMLGFSWAPVKDSLHVNTMIKGAWLDIQDATWKEWNGRLSEMLGDAPEESEKDREFDEKCALGYGV